MSRRKKRIIICCLGLVGAFLLFARQIVPSGLGGMKQIIPYLFFSQSRGVFVPPGGTSRVEVVTNDAGAAHSGHFPTWVVREHWYGDEVVAKGYLEESQGPFPLKWTGPRTFTIGFVKGRYDDTPAPQLVTLR